MSEQGESTGKDGSRLLNRKVSRRALLRGSLETGAGLLSLAVIGCGSKPQENIYPTPKEPVTKSESPKTPTTQPEVKTGQTVLRFAEGVPPEVQQEIREMAEPSIKWIREKTGVTLAGLTIFADGNASRLIENYLERTNFSESVKAGERQNLPNATAWAGQQKDIFILTSSPGWTRASPIIGGPVKEGRVHTFVHELFHVVQRELKAYDNTIFPQWLNEGGAHYVAARVLEENRVYDYAKIREGHLNIATNVINKNTRLQSMESSEGFLPRGQDARNYSLAFLACEFMTRGLPDSGLPALVKFWEQLGKGTGWADAFEPAFKKKPGDFYTEFEAYRARGFQ